MRFYEFWCPYYFRTETVISAEMRCHRSTGFGGGRWTPRWRHACDCYWWSRRWRRHRRWRPGCRRSEKRDCEVQFRPYSKCRYFSCTICILRYACRFPSLTMMNIRAFQATYRWTRISGLEALFTHDSTSAIPCSKKQNRHWNKKPHGKYDFPPPKISQIALQVSIHRWVELQRWNSPEQPHFHTGEIMGQVI